MLASLVPGACAWPIRAWGQARAAADSAHVVSMPSTPRACESVSASTAHLSRQRWRDAWKPLPRRADATAHATLTRRRAWRPTFHTRTQLTVGCCVGVSARGTQEDSLDSDRDPLLAATLTPSPVHPISYKHSLAGQHPAT
eukprot:scaffold3362_cov402-Prasinococcus_capsulatus_cf.AAC.11